MANFPSIEPASRALTFGDYPQLTYTSISGGDVRFLQGTKRITQVLSLGYQYLSEANTQLILDHYAGQEGTLIAFDLPAIIWLGYTTPPVSSVDYQWRYASAFDVAIAAPIQYSFTIELIAVPIP